MIYQNVKTKQQQQQLVVYWFTNGDQTFKSMSLLFATTIRSVPKMNNEFYSKYINPFFFFQTLYH